MIIERDYKSKVTGGYWLNLLKHGRNNKLSEEFIKFFTHFYDHTYTSITKEFGYTLDMMLYQFQCVMADPKYQISPDHVYQLIDLNPAIANAVAMSSHATTDKCLQLVFNQSNSLAKILILYSMRNEMQLDYGKLFSNPQLASAWYYRQFEVAGTQTNKTVQENLRKHLSYVSPQLTLSGHQAVSGYFNSIYINAGQQEALKSKINELIRKTNRDVVIRCNPNPKSIAVLSSKWFAASSVYRCYAMSVKKLAEKYDLTLVHLGDKRDDLDTAGFKSVKHICVEDDHIDISSLDNNDFRLAFFPDVGMSYESVYLSNIRLAPTMVCTHGHPSSTYGSEIDYFISGAALELPNAQEHYAEKLILIPGIGQPTIRPQHFCVNIDKKPSRFEGVVINCPISQDKTTHDYLLTLKEITDGAKIKVLFRFFPNQAILRDNYLIPYLRDIHAVLGTASEVCLCFGQDYIDKQREGDMSLDSFPFNGMNTVIDSLLLGKPIITLEGQMAQERCGAALLRKAGLSEFIANTREAYIRKALVLINDEVYRKAMSSVVSGVDLDSRIFNDDGSGFVTAIDSLMENQ